MSEKSNTLDVLTRVPTEMEANLIVQCLTECGIEAIEVGGFTSGFKAEAPGNVSVLVKHDDLARAMATLTTIHQEITGEQTNESEDEKDTSDETESDEKSLYRSFWQWYLIVNAISIPISFINSIKTQDYSLFGAIICEFLFLGLLLHLTWYAYK